MDAIFQFEYLTVHLFAEPHCIIPGSRVRENCFTQSPEEVCVGVVPMIAENLEEETN
jgi:hypothetical protein